VLQLVADGPLPPTTPFTHVQSAAFGLLDRAALTRTATYLVTGAGCDETAFIWEHIDTLSRRFKGRLRPLLKAIPLEASTATSPLLEAVHFLQDLATRGRPLSQVAAHTIPTQCLPVRLKRYLYTKAADGTPQLIRDRYEFYVYTALRAALESGDLVCPQSIRFRSLDDDLIPLDDWHAHRAALIAGIEAPILQQPIADHLAELEQALEAQFAAVNGRIARGENPGVTIKKHGKTQTWTLQTPKGRERPNHALFETLPQVSLNAVLAYVERACGFMGAFEHILGRGHQHARDDRVLRACLIAWGTNLSLHRMGESCDLPTGWLIRASENYLRLETVQAATTTISNAIAALPLFRAYDLGGVIHSTSDGQKFATDHDTLKAQHSPKYYGLGKGVVSISLVASNIPLDARMVSAHDAESQWVFDLLYNNPTDIRPAIHSTDTHGTNHVNFALLKVFGVEFAPRYADLRAKIATGLYGGQHPSQYGADALLRPVRKLNLDLISREWDNLLRIFVSLARKTTTQRVLVSKLSATKRRNRTLQALWEYDHLVASQYLLDYVQSETVRQHVQRALNRGEQYHQLKRALTQGNAGKLRFSSDEEQELWDACSRLLVNAILYYNIRMLSDAVALKEAHGDGEGAAFLKDVSPVGWHHINLHGQYAFGDEPDAVPLAHCVATIVQYHPADTPSVAAG
jgi:TnpA family transposase